MVQWLLFECYSSLSVSNKTFQSGATHVYRLQPNNSILLTQIPGTKCFWKNISKKHWIFDLCFLSQRWPSRGVTSIKRPEHHASFVFDTQLYQNNMDNHHLYPTNNGIQHHCRCERSKTIANLDSSTTVLIHQPGHSLLRPFPGY